MLWDLYAIYNEFIKYLGAFLFFSSTTSHHQPTQSKTALCENEIYGKSGYMMS